MVPPPDRYRPLLVQLVILGTIVAVGHSDRALSSMLTFGWVAVVPLAYAMARLPRVEARRWIHITIIGLYGLMDVSEISFTDDRLDALLGILAFLLSAEVLWWVVRGEFEHRVLRLASALARYLVLPCMLMLSTCMPLAAIAGPIDIWRRTIVAEHHGPSDYEYVKQFDSPGALNYYKNFGLYRPVPRFPILERRLGVYGTGQSLYFREHEFEWRTAGDGARSLVVTAKVCRDEERRRSDCEGRPADMVCFDSFELANIGAWPAVRPQRLDSSGIICESSEFLAIDLD